MFVKVLAKAGVRSADLFTVDPLREFRYGSITFDTDPADLTCGEIVNRLQVSAGSCSRNHLDHEPSGYLSSSTAEPFWEVSWAWLHRPDDPETLLVVASTPVFILNDNGRTIDRVR